MAFLGDFNPTRWFADDGLLDDAVEKAGDFLLGKKGVVGGTVGRAADFVGDLLDTEIVFSSDRLGIDRVDVTITEVLGAAIASTAAVGAYTAATAAGAAAAATPVGAPAAYVAPAAGAAAATAGAVGLTGAAVGAGTGLLGTAVQAGGNAVVAAQVASATKSVAFYAFAAFGAWLYFRRKR